MSASISRATISALAALTVGAVGCAETDYLYAPDTANARASGLPAAKIAIPPEQPQGSVELTSFGLSRLHSGSSTLPVLHVRMIVTNEGDNAPWTVDTRQQLASIPGEGQSRAMYVNSDVQAGPIVSVGRRERRTLDLYFPLPETVRSERNLPRFEMLWQVSTPLREVADRTTFERISDESTEVAYAGGPYVGSAYWGGYGPYWWYDPFYPNVAFVHTRPFGFSHGGRVGVGHFGGGFRAGGARMAGGGGHRR